MASAAKLSVVRPSITRVQANEFMNVLREEIRRSTKNGNKLKDIAKRANVCTQTVSNILYDKTKLPRLVTVVSLLAVFGYVIVAERVG